VGLVVNGSAKGGEARQNDWRLKVEMRVIFGLFAEKFHLTIACLAGSIGGMLAGFLEFTGRSRGSWHVTRDPNWWELVCG
jgi:hypothetical protein